MPSTTLDVRTRAPIAKLPNELLRSIFLLTGRDLPSTLALTGVCSRWRAVALDAPRLWTTIRWDACAPAQRARVALQLSRAGCMPLRIRLSFPPRALDAEGLDALVGTLEHVLPRVECFAFQSEASAPASRVLSVLERTHMPLLEDLAIVADPECTVTNATYLPMSVPPLRRLRLVGVPLAWPSAGFAGLKSLALCFGREALKPEFLDLLDALRSCSETLEYLELQCVLQCTPIDEAFHHGEAEEALDEDQGSDTQDIPTVHANGSSVSQGTDSVSDNDDGYSDAASVSTATELSEDLYEAISVACAATLNPADAIVFPNLTELRLAFAYPIEGVALLRQVSPPNLKHLHITDTRNMRPNYDERAVDVHSNIVLRNLLSYGNRLPLPQLESLALSGLHHCSRAAIGPAIVDRCISLQHLHLARCDVGFYAPKICAHPADKLLGPDSIVYGNRNTALRTVHAVVRDLGYALAPFLGYMKLARKQGFRVVPFDELVIDYETDPEATMMHSQRILAEKIVLRRFAGGVDSFVTRQEREAGLVEEQAPEEVVELQ